MLAALATALGGVGSLAAPTGGVVTLGTGSVTQSGALTTVVQTTDRLGIDWQTFNIGAAETVRFVQPGAQSVALNRVLGQDASQIYGHLQANGQVFLINSGGVLFGRGAQVDVGGLVASTLDLKTQDFAAGRFDLSGSGNRGEIVNLGSLNAPGGYVALLGAQVSNQGSISAPAGTVALAAGNAMRLSLDGSRLLDVQVSEGAVRALVDNGHVIRADGGTVLLTAKARDALLDAVVNNSGVVEARTLQRQGGVIKLLADQGQVNVSGKLDASAPDGGNGGFIETSAAKVNVAATAVITSTAAAGQAGRWLIDPDDFTIAPSGGNVSGSVLSAARQNNGDVTIQTTAGSTLCTGTVCSPGTGGNGDIFVNDRISWTSGNSLTLQAYGRIDVNRPIDWTGGTLTLNAGSDIHLNGPLNGSGSARLALWFGQAAPEAGNTSDYFVNAAVNLPAGPNFSTKRGSDGEPFNYTVVTSLGEPGDVLVLPCALT